MEPPLSRNHLSTSPTLQFVSGEAGVVPSPTPSVKARASSTGRSPGNRNNNTTIDTTTSHTLVNAQHQQHHPHQNNASAPISTPNHSDNILFMSPSRTLSQGLNALTTSTGNVLEGIWNVVGYRPEDRAAQLSELLNGFKELCERKIAEERVVEETFRQTITEAYEEIKQTAAALKISVDPHLLHNDDNNNRSSSGQKTLTEQLAKLEAALEGMRSTADAAKEKLLVCRDSLVEAHKALGLEMDPTWLDIDSDLTLERQNEFLRKKAEMKEELSTRTSAVIQLVRDCQSLTHDLQIDVENDGSELDKRIAGSLVRGKDNSFIMASTFRSKTCVGISAKSMDELTKRVAELHGEKERRKAKFAEMGAEIFILWEKLRVPEEEQEEFTKGVQGMGLETFQMGELELKRLRALKSEMLGNLIEEARETISSLWDQLNAPLEQRKAFEHISVPVSLFSDELLEQHDDYVGLLREKLEKMKPIVRLVEKREDIIRERMEYENLQKDPDRLTQRGAALTRQLMEEEKMARRIKKDLPKLTELLIQKLQEWAEEHGEDFQYHGDVYFELMDRQEEEWQHYKENEMHRKLKKKQVEKALVENRFAKKFVPHSHPPPQANKKTTKAAAPNVASRALGDAFARENSKGPTTRTRSHDGATGYNNKNIIVKKPTAPANKRGFGNKQQSTRF